MLSENQLSKTIMVVDLANTLNKLGKDFILKYGKKYIPNLERIKH